MIKSHKIKLNPTPEQKAYFWQACKVSRNAWNWALGEYNKRKEAGQKVKITGKGDTLKNEYTRLKTEFDFAYDVTTYASQQAFLDLQKTVSMYYKKLKAGELKPPKDWKGRKDDKPYGWPRFKSVFKSTPSFYESNIGLRFDGNFVKLPKIGSINMAEPLRFDGKVQSGRITYIHGRWWLSVSVEVDHDIPENNNPAVGIDLGIKYLAYTSDPDREPYSNPKPFVTAQRRLRRLQRHLERQKRANNPDYFNDDGTPKKGTKTWVKSKNMRKTERQIEKLHYQIACIRNEAAHEMTTAIATNYSIIGVEDLNIKGMMKNKRIAKALADAALYEKRRQLEYKANWNGGIVIPVDRWFPSSKKCNGCDWINVDLKQSDRQWTCGGCGTVHHRDGNAANNIEDEALRIFNLTNEKSSPDYPTET
jgi:putative transposase